MIASHPLVAQVCMVSDGKPYRTMLVALDPDEAPTWADQHDLSYTDLDTFSRFTEVQVEIDNAIGTANRHVSRLERIRKFTIVSDTWSSASGELTASLTVRRRIVLERYADEIERMYAV